MVLLVDIPGKMVEKFVGLRIILLKLLEFKPLREKKLLTIQFISAVICE
jgi:hypothetical protein